MDSYNFEELAKQIAVERLKDAEDVPAAAGLAARELVAKAVTGTQARQDPRVTVTAVCRGIASGVLLLEKDLPSTSVALLRQMSAVALETNLDPAELMTWAMEGLAPVCRLAGEAAQGAVQEAIESAFMGAGEVFAKACRTVV